MLNMQQKDLLCQALETELGGVELYKKAIECARNEDLRKEWNEYYAQTREHVRTLKDVFGKLDVDTEMETPGRGVVRHIGESLVHAMEKAKQGGDGAATELVACECVTLAETKDHQNWELIGELAKQLDGEAAKALKHAYEQVEEEEDEHLYHTQGWCRELWIKFIGLKAVLPPPEEKKHVKSAIGAARAKQARKSMVPRKKRTRSAAR